MIADTKKCFNCKIEKPLKNFYQTKSNVRFPDGYYHLCKECIVSVVGNDLSVDVAKLLYEVDVPLMKTPWASAIKRKGETILEYLKIMNQVRYKKLSYNDSELTLEVKKDNKFKLEDEYLAFNKEERATEKESKDLDKLFDSQEDGTVFILANNGKKIMLTDELRKKWLRKDSSFDDDEILELEKYFVDMKNDFTIENTSAINLLYELSVLSVKKQRALSDDNISDYDKLDKSFQNKLKVSGFQPIDEKDSLEKTGVTSFGQIVAQIERDSGFIPPNLVKTNPDDIDLMLMRYKQWAQRFTDQPVDVEVDHTWREDIKSEDIDFSVHDTSEGEPEIVADDEEN
ncbi:hypothetical protein [Lactococcus phage P1048]|uniref:Uncharacterized protein n=1 Tax=Lactococcus phage P1048 TaxID=2662295 RepID=A0A649V328_9CAUD|nr:hypothetical protein H1Z36_gp086 [Lactococcus phage P1048]QGJ85042.1 hypothetical protein [Lactococcus phage P1048]